jgi:HSP20 family protein
MVKYKHFTGSDFGGMQQRMEKILDSVFDEMRPTIFSAEQAWKPPVDIYETPEEIVVLAEISGMKKKNITVTMENDVLKISGTRPDYSPSAKMKLHQMEIDYGKFQRIVKISLPIDTHNIRAQYREGFLQITLSKKKLTRTAGDESTPEDECQEASHEKR